MSFSVFREIKTKIEESEASFFFFFEFGEVGWNQWKSAIFEVVGVSGRRVKRFDMLTPF